MSHDEHNQLAQEREAHARTLREAQLRIHQLELALSVISVELDTDEMDPMRGRLLAALRDTLQAPVSLTDQLDTLYMTANRILGDWQVRRPWDCLNTEEPINWADLKAHVEYVVTQHPADDRFVVTIEEAAPDACPIFCQTFLSVLRVRGWTLPTEIRTEW